MDTCTASHSPTVSASVELVPRATVSVGAIPDTLARCCCVDLPDRLLKEIMTLTFPKTWTEEEIPLSVELDTLPPADQERLLKTKKELSQSVHTPPTHPSSLTPHTCKHTCTLTESSHACSHSQAHANTLLLAQQVLLPRWAV